MSPTNNSSKEKLKASSVKVVKKTLNNSTVQLLLEKLKELELMIKLSGELTEKEKLELKSELELLVTKSNLQS